jgi:hypothetical protein
VTDATSRPLYAIDAVRGEWATVQDQFFGEVPDSVLRLTHGGRLPPVVLVHGFNAGDPVPGYAALRHAIKERALPGVMGDSVAFLELHWAGSDGMRSARSTRGGKARATPFP